MNLLFSILYSSSSGIPFSFLFIGAAVNNKKIEEDVEDVEDMKVVRFVISPKKKKIIIEVNKIMNPAFLLGWKLRR